MSDADRYSCMELAVEAMDLLLLRDKESGFLGHTEAPAPDDEQQPSPVGEQTPALP
jgi:hypothetical protein